MSRAGRAFASKVWRHPGSRTGLILLGTVVAFACLGPWLIGADPNLSDFSLNRGPLGGPPGPSSTHLLGSDALFRDVLARLAAGARMSLAIALGATVLATAIGSVVGVLSGYFAGRWPDRLVTGFVDVALAFPFLLLITAIGVALAQTDAVTVALVLGLTGWPGVARIVRAKTCTVTASNFVHCARALGVNHRRMVLRHIVPGLRGTLLVLASQMAASMLLAEAVLGYLTVGVPPPQASWGRMLHEAEHFIGVAPWLVAPPAVAILITVVGLIRVADGLGEVLDETTRPTRKGFGGAIDLLVIGVGLTSLLLTGAAPLKPPSALTAAATPPAKRPAAKELKLATHVRVYHLDPAVAYDEASRRILDATMARLVRFDAQGRTDMQLAKHVQISPDGLRYRFDLRSGLQFHDGTPLLAVDVKRSLERTLHPKTPCPAAELFRAITGFESYRSNQKSRLSGVQVVDDLTLRITLDHPDASFLSALTMGFAAPVCTSMGAHATLSKPSLPCGAGPFRVTHFDSGHSVRLSRFESYHERSLPRIDQIQLAFGIPARTQRYQFEAGEIDIISELSGVDTARFLRAPAWAPQRTWVRRAHTNGIFLNTALRPFDNRHLRRAVAFGIDREQLSRINPQNEVSTRIVPAALLPPPATANTNRRANVPAALREMQLAGHPYDPATQRGGYPYEIPYLVVPGTFEQMAAEVFQQQLARIGIRIRLELLNWAAMLERVGTRGAAVMGWRGWAADYPDPSAFFEPTLSSAAIADHGGQNVSFFSDPRLDALLARADRETGHLERLRLFEQAEDLVREEAPWIPVYAPRMLHVWHKHVRQYDPRSPYALEQLPLVRGAR